MHRTKKAILIKFIGVSLVALLFACNSKPGQVGKNKASQYGVFKFTEKTYDFGKIKNGDTVSHVFTFSNVGKYPLIIKDISTACGCTAVEYTKTPIPPNGTGSIRVQFSKRNDPGLHTKAAIISANTPDKYTVIRIRALI